MTYSSASSNSASGRIVGTNEGPVQIYDGPPDYRTVGRHDMSPDLDHDEIERLNFLTQMNRHLAGKVLPFVSTAYEKRVEPALKQNGKSGPKDRHDVRNALLNDPMFQTWSALRRATMEQRQQAGRWTTLRQSESLAEKARALTQGDSRLSLDPKLKMPRYVAAIDHHCMPGSYHKEMFPGDVSGAASYDHGLFVTTGGALGRWCSGGGHAVVDWVKKNLPDFKPKRILDIGATVGHNALPIAQGFQDAHVVAVDLGAPVLRYALARAKSLGVENISFIQADATNLSQFADGSFDWVQTTMFLHELSHTALRDILAESFRLLAPGGIMLHVEQPQYTPEMPLFEQAMRDWDAFYNNEPFWSKMHEIDMDAYIADAGFARDHILHADVEAILDADEFEGPKSETAAAEDYGRKAAWHVIGAYK
jgi:ubiquinone/menaquinone biosynthesis C-methylase UbiE